MNIPKLILLGFVSILLLTLNGFAEVIEQQFDVQPGGTLYIDSDVGSIEVSSHSSNTVEVTALRENRGFGSDEQFIIDISQSGSDINITGRFEDRGIMRRGNFRVEYRVKVPSRYNVDLNTAGGSIEVDDLDGKADCETSGGSIVLGNISGEVIARTSGGSIELVKGGSSAELKTSGGGIRVGDVNGNVIAKTSGGSITAENINGFLEAGTSGGSIKVEDVAGSVEAKTSGGSIHASMVRQPEKGGYMKTSGGSVILYLDDDIGIDVDASTSGGKVYTDFDVTIRGELKKHQLRGKLNGGGPEYELRTSGGNIKILRK